MEATNLNKIVKLKENDKAGNLQNIILVDDGTVEVVDKAKSLGLVVYKYQDIILKGQGQSVEFNNCKPETVATLSYTSGTTGMPKGTMILHQQITSEIS